MKRIVIFSDTHGDIHPCLRVLPSLGTVDLIVHLGDTVTDAQTVRGAYPEIPFVSVRGNNDWFSPEPLTATAEIDGVRMLCCHGHACSRAELLRLAREQDCRYVLSGHTHRAARSEEEGIVFLNPGSTSRPRGGEASYAVIEIENGAAADAIIPC